jgi:hypothetical protein
MNRNQILLLLGSVGVYLYGPLTPDAIAFARAIQSGNPSDLQTFADQHRHSTYSKPALNLAKRNLRCWPGVKIPGTGPEEGCSRGSEDKGGYQS